MNDGLDVMEAVKVEVQQSLELAEGLSHSGTLDRSQRRESLVRQELYKIVYSGVSWCLAVVVCILKDVFQRR